MALPTISTALVSGDIGVGKPTASNGDQEKAMGSNSEAARTLLRIAKRMIDEAVANNLAAREAQIRALDADLPICVVAGDRAGRRLGFAALDSWRSGQPVERNA